MKHIIEANARISSQPTAPSVKYLEVDADSTGQRLDNFLLRHLKGVPKTHVYRIIRSGEVRINKGRVTADSRVQQGDVVRVPPVRVSERLFLSSRAGLAYGGNGQERHQDHQLHGRPDHVQGPEKLVIGLPD